MSNRRKGRKIYTYRVKNRRMFSKYHPMRSALGVTVLVFLVALFGVVGYSILGPLMTRLPKEKENPTRTPDPYVFTTAPTQTTASPSTQTNTITEPTETTPIEPLQLGLYLNPNTINDSTKLTESVVNAANAGYSSVIVPLRLEGGALQYYSEVPQAQECQATSEKLPTLQDILATIHAADLTAVARIETISDTLFPLIEPDSAYHLSGKDTLWLDDAADSGGKAWMCPTAESSQTYLSAIIDEISMSGFSQILCGGMHYPKFFQSDLEAIGASVTATDSRRNGLISMLNAIGDASPLTTYEFDLKDAISGNEEGMIPDKLNIKNAVVKIDFRDFEDPFFYKDERFDISKLAYKDKMLLLTQLATDLAYPLEITPCIVKGTLTDLQLQTILDEMHAAEHPQIYIET